MGQQQLLLVILVTIIVGIATVVAINVFGTSAESANRDAVRQDVLTIAAAAQGWYIKPTMMGGGGNSFAGMTFNDINFSAEELANSGGTAMNMNGIYEISSADETQGNTMDSFTVTAHPSSDEGYSNDIANPASDDPMEAWICKDNVDWDADCAH